MIAHLVESTIFAGAAALLALLLRGNRARVRYGIWLAASIKFLVPFALLTSLGTHVRWRGAPAIPEPAEPLPAIRAVRPLPAPVIAPVRPAAAPRTDWTPIPIHTIWAIGSGVLLLTWSRRWRVLHTAVRNAAPVALPLAIEARASQAFREPGIFGIHRPILLLPAGLLDHLSPAQRDAVVAHELCHARRRDNLTAVIHMTVEALFWFHPLVWWLGARLIAERERACDEAVLREGRAPECYAEGILRVCEFCVGSPLPCVAGVTGGDLTQRIEAIVHRRTGEALTSGRKVLLTCAAMGALAAPIAAGLWNAPFLDAQTAVSAKFEVASVKPCADSAGSAGTKKGGGGGPGGMHWTPDRLSATCVTVDNLIRDAYLSYPEGKRWAAATSLEPSPEAFGVPYGGGCFFCGRGVAPVSLKTFHMPIEGSPGWAGSERFTIDAKAEAPTTPEMMRGPMMQALLADRFKLKIRREGRAVPVYELTVAPGGARLQPSSEASCFTGPPPSRRGGSSETPARICGRGGVVTPGGNDYASPGTTIARLCFNLSGVMDRDVVDRTGLSGVFDITLNAHIATRELSAAPPDPDAPRRPPEYDGPANFKIFQAALAKVGLKLTPASGTAVRLVIDHVERPSGN